MNAEFFKPVEITIRRELRKKRKIEEMNKFR
jgi:hypothetical protein